MTNTTRRRASFAALALALMPGALVAAELDLPSGARQTARVVSESDSYRLPTGPWKDGYLPAKRLEGRISREGWRIDRRGITTLQLLDPLRQQLVDAGFDVLFECAAPVCGGFDFRFATEVLNAPAIYVDMTDYRFLSAERRNTETDGADHVSILVSRSGASNYVQIIRAGVAASAGETQATAAVARPAEALPAEAGDIAQQLETVGHSILSDLAFDSGSSNLGEGPFASLEALAAYLTNNPQREIMFVGHTDATGSLDANIALSRRRAQSVVDYLTGTLGVRRQQVSAQGVGYLSPVASSLTDEGRDANRRVEAVLISTE